MAGFAYTYEVISTLQPWSRYTNYNSNAIRPTTCKTMVKYRYVTFSEQ